MKAAWLVGIVVILVILGTGLLYIWQITPVEQPVDELFDQGEISLPEAPVEKLTPVNQAPAEVEPAVLSAVGSYEGAGIATRSFDGITFTHAVEASLADPTGGKFYEGWLVMKTTTGPKFFSTGKMTKEGEVYTLTYTAAQNYPDHNDVVITEETLSQGLDGQPEAHVLEGSFKP